MEKEIKAELRRRAEKYVKDRCCGSVEVIYGIMAEGAAVACEVATKKVSEVREDLVQERIRNIGR